MDINRETFTAAFEAVVERFGADYRYQRPVNQYCAYVHVVDGKPEAGCVGGQILAELGVSLDVLRQYDRSTEPGSENLWSTDIGTVLGKLGVRDAGLIFASGVAQTNQDMDVPWGLCLESYKRELANFPA